jgi:hypothetical protein
MRTPTGTARLPKYSQPSTLLLRELPQPPMYIAQNSVSQSKNRIFVVREGGGWGGCCSPIAAAAGMGAESADSLRAQIRKSCIFMRISKFV